MRKLLVFTILAGMLSLSLQAQVPVPKRMTYCGMDLTITPGAQRIIEDYVAKIYESPRYFNQMVKRAMIYVPFIEEAFDNVGVPQDLKYLAIQESALRPDVVSSSNAVGFWQFKAPTAKQYGLRVNDKVDERQHIYRASEAAAAYLKANNRDFDNWVYAVLAYYEGPTGAVKHTDPAYYSNPKMTVTESLHWYVLKAIAHKIAYEGPLSSRKVPPLVLRPTSNQGEHNVAKLIEQSDSDAQQFLDYNKWILDDKKLPKNELFTYYIPLNPDLYTGHVSDPNKVIGGGMPVFDQLTQLANTASSQTNEQPPVETTPTEPITLNQAPKQSPVAAQAEPKIVDQGTEATIPTEEKTWTSPTNQPQVRGGSIQLPKALPTTGLNSFTFVEFSLQADLHYGRQYVLYDGSFYLVELANKYETRLTDLLVWNGLIPGEEPVVGNMVYLDKPSRLDYHIVRPGESLFDIAALHLTTVKKLQKYNHIDKRDYTIYIGQKLYLKEKKPRGEKMIVLTPQKETPIPPAATTSANTKPAEDKVQSIPSTPSADDSGSLTKITDLAESTPRPAPTQTRPEGITETELAAANGNNTVGEMPTKRWVQHTVKPGETLWAISQLYGTKVEIIKQINKLENDYISEGQTLRILADF